jgi:hypothetical protein
VPLCERFMPKDFCKKCRRVAAACLCVTAVGAHGMPHTHQERASIPITRVVTVTASSTAATGIDHTGMVNRPPWDPRST